MLELDSTAVGQPRENGRKECRGRNPLKIGWERTDKKQRSVGWIEGRLGKEGRKGG